VTKPVLGRLLVVDDESMLVVALCRTLEAADYRTTGVGSGTEALAALRAAASDGSGAFDLVITDLRMPGMDGIDLLRAAQQIDPDLVGIVMTGHGTIDTAVEAMRSGATDYILKPFNFNAVRPVLTRALTIRRLRLQNAHLECQVAEHIAQLEVVNLDLQAANKELEAFTATISHDVRAPLSAMIGFSELILSERPGPLSAKQKEYLGDIRDSGVKLIDLTGDLLRFSRLGHQPLAKEVVDVGGLVQEVIRGLVADAQGRHIEIQLGGLPSVNADRALLQQVFVNLLSNAFKFTRHTLGAAIEVSGEEDAAGCTYRIRDNGAGFDMEHAAKLFAIFHRLPSAKDFEGTGVGLSIVRRIVERHGGSVSASGQRGKGAEFTVVLPRSAEPPLPAPVSIEGRHL
jgi:signal transduction histidine kinase